MISIGSLLLLLVAFFLAGSALGSTVQWFFDRQRLREYQKTTSNQLESTTTYARVLEADVSRLKGLLKGSQNGQVPDEVLLFLRKFVLPKMMVSRVNLGDMERFRLWLESQSK